MVVTSRAFSAFLELYDGSGTRISSGFDSLTQRLNGAGPYTVLARDFGNARTGGYRLFLQRVNQPCNAVELSCGQSFSDAISAVGETDTFQLQGVGQGDVIKLEMVVTSGSFSPFLELYDGSGTRISSGFDSLTHRLAGAGPYTVLARDFGNARTGGYRLFLQRVNNPCGAASVPCGQNLGGAIGALGETDTYQFQGVGHGDVIRLVMAVTSGAFSAFLELYDGSGTRVSNGFDSLTHRLDGAGPYTILARDYGHARTGDYRLSLQRVNNPCNAIPLAIGQSISEAIDFAAEADAYTIRGVAGIATLCLVTTAGPLSACMDLYDTSGTQQERCRGEIQRNLAGGTANLFVRDFGDTDTGRYRLHFAGGAIQCSSLDLAEPAVTVTSPKGGELLDAGSQFVITWTAQDNKGVVGQEIRLSRDGGATFPTAVATGLPGNVRSFRWTIPAGLKTTQARIRVIARDAAKNAGRDDSDSDFFIIDIPPTKLIRYTYDVLNRLVRVEYPDGTVITYTYDELGNRTSLTVKPRRPGG